MVRQAKLLTSEIENAEPIQAQEVEQAPETQVDLIVNSIPTHVDKGCGYLRDQAAEARVFPELFVHFTTLIEHCAQTEQRHTDRNQEQLHESDFHFHRSKRTSAAQGIPNHQESDKQQGSAHPFAPETYYCP